MEKAKKHEISLSDQVKLCAEAMGLDAAGSVGYCPITNELQAMALIKRFMLHVDAFAGMAELPEGIHPDQHRSFSDESADESINYAIVHCISLMQSAKKQKT